MEKIRRNEVKLENKMEVAISCMIPWGGLYLLKIKFHIPYSEFKWKWSRSVVSGSLWPHELGATRLLRLWDFPGKDTGVGCHFLLQEIFPTQGLNSGLPHCRQMLYRLSHQGSSHCQANRFFSFLQRKPSRWNQLNVIVTYGPWSHSLSSGSWEWKSSTHL